MKTLSLVITLTIVLSAGLAWATTYTTPTLDGIIGTDWDPDEQFETMTFDNADYTLWITWDGLIKQEPGVYIGMDRVLDPDNRFLGDAGPDTLTGYLGDISLFVAIDTDQIPGSGATSDGYGRVTFSGAHLPEHVFYYAGGVGWYEWGTWDQLNGLWNWNGWTDQHTYYGWNNDVNIDDEVLIPWSWIGNPQGIAVRVWITNEGSGPVLAAWPHENPVGDLPDLPWSYEFYAGHYYDAAGISMQVQPAFGIIPNITDHSVPVTLSSFTATGRKDAIEISWTSQTEVNALAYHLYRGNGEHGQFAEIARLDAAGNSETPQSYHYVDTDVVSSRTYYYQLADEDYEGNLRYHGTVFASAGSSVPGAYALMPNYPNPFNPSTTIGYQTPRDGQVTLTVYNVLGQEIRTLVDAHQAAGSYTVMWDSKDAGGRDLTSGIYFYTLKAGDYTETRKMVLMR